MEDRRKNGWRMREGWMEDGGKDRWRIEGRMDGG